MQFYVSKNHDRLNGKPFTPETVSDRLCLNPLYKATVQHPDRVRVLLDSGAFQDRKTSARLSFQAALSRQLTYEDNQGFDTELLVSYDRLVDEAAGSVGKNKKRVAHSTGKRYVEETINAAKHLADQRRDLSPRKLLLSCQGVTVPQYVGCVKEVLSFANKNDVLGYGGFCLIGQQRHLVPQFLKVLQETLPLVKKKGLRRVHFFGVGIVSALVKASMLCRMHGITPSYDTSSYEFNGIMGRVVDPGLRSALRGEQFTPLGVGMVDIFGKNEKRTWYHPTDLALLNVRLVQNFWDEINELPIDVLQSHLYGSKR